MKKKVKRKKILFISSAGGHLAQLLELQELFEKYEYLLVTEGIDVNKEITKNYNTEFLKSAGKGRNLEYWINLVINIFRSFIIFFQFNPDIILTTGSHTAIPMCYIGKVFRRKIVFILSFSKINTKAKTANIVYPIADLFIVQWETMKKYYPKAIYLNASLY